MATVPNFDPQRQCDDLDPFTPDDVPPSEPTLPFPDWIGLAASTIRFHGNGSSASTWLAAKIEELAALAQRFQATCPAEFEARIADAERDREHDLWNKAQAHGYDACVKAHSLQSCYQ